MNLACAKDHRVVVGSRIHLTLANTTVAVERVFGGVGLYIREPNVTVCVEQSERWEFDDALLAITSERWLRDLFATPVRLTVSPAPRFHIGLGATTQILLAVVLLAQRLAQRPTSIEELARKARRGGASGVGVEVFIQGGIVIDLGRAKDRQESRLLLSELSDVCYERRPVVRLCFPEWTVVVGMPLTVQRIFGEAEASLFDEIGSVPVSECQEAAWYTLYEVMPGIISREFELFCNGIEHLRRTGFKAREISVWDDIIEKAIQKLESIGLRGVTMSSWGPTIVGFSLENPENLERRLESVRDDFEFLAATTALNSGAECLNCISRNSI